VQQRLVETGLVLIRDQQHLDLLAAQPVETGHNDNLKRRLGLQRRHPQETRLPSGTGPGGEVEPGRNEDLS
jgi:hypothetical protein